MRYLKSYEENNNFRLVDLIALFDDFDKYRPELGVSYMTLVRDILIDNNIEFHRVKNKIDGEISYSFGGKVKRVELCITTKIKSLRVYLYDDGKCYIIPLKTKKISELGVVKIYNTELTKYEKEIEFLKNVNNYNL